MRRTSREMIAAAALALAIAGAGAVSTAASATGGPERGRPAGQPAAPRYSPHPACGTPGWGHASCMAIIDGHVPARDLTAEAQAARRATAPGGQPDPYTVPQPYMAADLQAAYKLPSSLLGARQTIAIVDAYDNPNAAADLAAYRAANDLPACTATSGCFTKVNQQGQRKNYPPTPPRGMRGWTVEESIDVDMATATCPNCRIILVEANSNANNDLFASEDEAATLGANAISNSWGEAEYRGEAADCRHFTHSGVAITVASGDSGFGVSFPASCGTVTAVGGTTLFPSATPRRWTDVAWAGTGSGCSAYISKPAWQRDRLCGMRTTADVSAVADPNTPVAIYDTFGQSGWLAVAGTSVSSPIIAGVYALAGNAATAGPGARHSYWHRRNLFDVTAGSPFTAEGEQSNGYCQGGYLCTAQTGYDGPTGWGTPDGIGAF